MGTRSLQNVAADTLPLSATALSYLWRWATTSVSFAWWERPQSSLKDCVTAPTSTNPFTFSAGRALQEFSSDHSYFEAVVGSRVAKEMNVGLGDKFYPTHGDPTGHGHDLGFTIVGVMDPTGTPNDRAAFVNLEGFYLMDGHAKPIEKGNAESAEDQTENNMMGSASESVESPAAASPDEYRLLSIPQREVTSLLVRTGDIMFAPAMQNAINEGIRAQAAAPVGEINKLMELIVGPLKNALLVITLITCAVAAVGILVAIYNSMNDRRRDIAVMRALGARRSTVTAIIVYESLLVSVIGAAIGWILAHAAIAAYSSRIEDQTGVQVGFFTTSGNELSIFPLVLVLALIAALLPAWSAYRTDVGSNLAA